MSLISFLKKPYIFVIILMLTSAIISMITSGLYFPKGNGLLVLNFFIFLTILIINLLLVAFYIAKLYQAKFSRKFMKTITYYASYYIATTYIVLPLLSLSICIWLVKTINPTAETMTYSQKILGKFINLNVFKALAGSTITATQAIFTTIGVGILFTILGIAFFYITLKIANKIASYFVSNSEEIA